jgi:putative permease
MIPIFRNWIDRYFYNEESVLLLVLFILSCTVIWSMGGILGPVFTALIITFLMQGFVAWLKARGVPHLCAVVVGLVFLLGFLIAAIVFFVPVLWKQSVNLASELPRMVVEWRQLLLHLPEKYSSVIPAQQMEELIKHVSRELGSLGQSVLSFSVENLPILFIILLYLVLVPVLVFFFLKDGKEILFWLSSILPKKRPVMSKIWTEMNEQIANYVRGKVVEILIVTVASYVPFLILGLNYAMLLAVAVGLSVLVPYVGAIVVTAPVLLIGFFQWGWSNELLYLTITYLVIQCLDGNVLVPLLFSEAVNLHPVAIILAVIVFGGLWGFWGVFFAIPLATLIKAIFNAWPTRNITLHSNGEITLEEAE